ncbi:hypothetical protein J2S13_001876 [Oikeobacillus pervagus]|uniref:Uncharacterized protein n=1 Tax=Oikeobacillus pervagus TaxID=1325931 RepID=A0AAJ1SZD6_9BACI|nr:CC/Se motif family (seleno)protein [Oikeobacillus pervagus]MDQ0215459.1 hypothetical protein [Oikeobacillus pervagus]
MDYTITFDEKATQWLFSKTAEPVIVVKPFQPGNCCVGGMEAEVTFVKPDFENLFHHQKVEGISIFIDQVLEFKDRHIHFYLTGFSVFKTLQVKGLKRF